MKFTYALAALAGSTNAWFGTGHLLVARIAENILTEKNPGKLAEAKNLLAQLEQSDAKLTKNEKNHPFVECATFADDFKYNGGFYQKGWHFIDQPWLDEGGKMSDYNFTYDVHNITEALNGLTLWMNDTKTDTYIKTTVENNTKTAEHDADAASIAMRLLIHYVGDIHQPLHAESRVDHEYPKGDFGGNTVKIPAKDGVNNLHAVWDSVAYEFSGYAKLPFTDSAWELNGKRAKALVTKHPVSSLKYDVTNLDPEQWAKESFDVADSFVYKGVETNHAVPSGYVPKAQDLAEERIVTAGYRLANLVEKLKLLPPNPKEQLFL